jgi:hypothetical protein
MSCSRAVDNVSATKPLKTAALNTIEFEIESARSALKRQCGMILNKVDGK